MTDPTQQYTQLAPGLAMGALPSARWQRLKEYPLLVLVGVTGVGKSTVEAALLTRCPLLKPLPNRRTLTDWLIIQALQQADGAAISPVADRTERFNYTRRYRDRYPGGMAHALSTLLVDPTWLTHLLCFDGLRGENEIRSATTLLPRAHFIMLDAPDVVRVQRLLQRQDSFDQFTHLKASAAPVAPIFPELDELFTPADAAMLRAMVASGNVCPDELQAKLRIVAAERRNYDPAATREALQTFAPARSLILDTVTMGPDDCAAQVESALVGWGLLSQSEMHRS